MIKMRKRREEKWRDKSEHRDKEQKVFQLASSDHFIVSESINSEIAII